MNTEIHKALGDVLDIDPGTVFEGSDVDDTFVRDESAGALVEHWKMRFQAKRHIVGI